jgi:hypothetical protein
MATRQGSLDCLCGVYSTLNAIEIVIGRYRLSQKTKNHITYKRALFNTLIGHLARKNMLKHALTNGIDRLDSKSGLINVAIKFVMKHHKLEINAQRAFDGDEHSLEEWWEKLSLHLSNQDAVAIILVTGRINHWTCVKQITAEGLVLADSVGIRFISRKHCLVGIELLGKYTMWPSITYFLSHQNEEISEISW